MDRFDPSLVSPVNYRRIARDFLTEAGDTSDLKHRAMLLELANGWFYLADLLEQQRGTRPAIAKLH